MMITYQIMKQTLTNKVCTLNVHLNITDFIHNENSLHSHKLEGRIISRNSEIIVTIVGRTLRDYISPKKSQRCLMASVQISSYLLVKVPPATIRYRLLYLGIDRRERGKPFTCYLRVMHVRIITVKS